MRNEFARKGEDVAVILLARGVSLVKVAKAAGICRQTLYQYLAEPDFRRRVDEVRNRLMDGVVGQVLAMGNKVLKRLDELLDSPNHHISLGACRAWKEFAVDLVNQYDLAKRIQEISEGNINSLNETTGEAEDDTDADAD